MEEDDAGMKILNNYSAVNDLGQYHQVRSMAIARCSLSI